MVCSAAGRVTLWFEYVGPAERALLFGAGHVNRAIHVALAPLGFETLFLDSRPELLRDLPAAGRRVAEGYRELADLPPLEGAHVVVATHGHALDEEVLVQLLSRDERPAYLGLVASRRKRERIFDSLRRRCGEDVDLARGARAGGPRARGQLAGGGGPVHRGGDAGPASRHRGSSPPARSCRRREDPKMNRTRVTVIDDRVVELEGPDEAPALEWLRRSLGVVGVHSACDEGECGACTVLLGEPTERGFSYRAVASCLLARGELVGRHLVTIEGLDPPEGLSPIQRALVDEGMPQCGFCLSGIVVSITGFFLDSPALTLDGGLRAVDGNICRCSGYASLRRALARLCEEYAPRLRPDRPRLEQLVEWGIVPRHHRRRGRAGGPGRSAAPPTRGAGCSAGRRNRSAGAGPGRRRAQSGGAARFGVRAAGTSRSSASTCTSAAG